MARIEAVLRRADGRAVSGQVPLSAGDLWVDFGSAVVRLKGEPVRLSHTELLLLSHLMRNAGRAVPYSALVGAIWGVDAADKIETQSIKVHILNLRRKLGDDAANPSYIGTAHGIGYRFLKQVTADTGSAIQGQDKPSGEGNSQSSSSES